MLAFNASELLLLLIVLQQGVAAPLWALIGRWRIAPRVPALHWATAAAMAAGSLLAPLLTPGLQGHLMSNMLAPGIFVLLRLGLHILFRVPRHDVEHTAVVLLAVGGSLGGALLDAPSLWYVALSSLLNAFSLLRTVQVVGPAARSEIGTEGVRLVFLPLAFVGLLFLARGLAAFVWPDEIGVPLERVTATNVALLAAIMTFGLLVHLCVGLAIALRLLGKMRDQSRLDSLTQLPNRRAADEMLQRLVRGARAQDQRATALAIDVDHFKRINDEHGHLAGDRALVHLARLLSQQLRSGDLLARMGGEELLVLLPDTGVAAACELGERLREVVAQSPLRWGSAEVRMTVSIGIAGLRAGERQADDWLARADALLYEAKREGRNRVKAEPQP